MTLTATSTSSYTLDRTQANQGQTVHLLQNNLITAYEWEHSNSLNGDDLGHSEERSRHAGGHHGFGGNGDGIYVQAQAR